MQYWTQVEVDILKEFYPLEGTNVKNRLPGRSKSACSSKVKTLQLDNPATKKYGARRTHTKYLEEISSTNYEVLEEYQGTLKPIKHRCKICGHIWSTRPSVILSGHGCPDCAGKNADKVYLIYFPELNLYKIGITNNVEKRLKRFGYKADVIWVENKNSHQEAKSREKQLLSQVVLFNTGLLLSGNTETFMEGAVKVANWT